MVAFTPSARYDELGVKKGSCTDLSHCQCVDNTVSCECSYCQDGTTYQEYQATVTNVSFASNPTCYDFSDFTVKPCCQTLAEKMIGKTATIDNDGSGCGWSGPADSSDFNNDLGYILNLQKGLDDRYRWFFSVVGASGGGQGQCSIIQFAGPWMAEKPDCSQGFQLDATAVGHGIPSQFSGCFDESELNDLGCQFASARVTISPSLQCGVCTWCSPDAPETLELDVTLPSDRCTNCASVNGVYTLKRADSTPPGTGCAEPADQYNWNQPGANPQCTWGITNGIAPPGSQCPCAWARVEGCEAALPNLEVYLCINVIVERLVWRIYVWKYTWNTFTEQGAWENVARYSKAKTSETECCPQNLTGWTLDYATYSGEAECDWDGMTFDLHGPDCIPSVPTLALSGDSFTDSFSTISAGGTGTAGDTDQSNDSSYSFSTVTDDTVYSWKVEQNAGDGSVSHDIDAVEISADSFPLGQVTILEMDTDFEEDEVYALAELDRNGGGSGPFAGFLMSDDQYYIAVQDFNDDEAAWILVDSDGVVDSYLTPVTISTPSDTFEMAIQYKDGDLEADVGGTAITSYSPAGSLTVKAFVVGSYNFSAETIRVNHVWVSSEEPSSGWPIGGGGGGGGPPPP